MAAQITQNVNTWLMSCLRAQTMDRFINKFLTFLEIEKNASRHTLLNYHIDLKQFFKFLSNKDISKIDRLDIRKYLAWLKGRNLKKRSVARKLSTLRSFFRFLSRDGYVNLNPVSAISTPKLEKKLPVFLDEKKVVKLIESPDATTVLGLRDRAIMETLYSTGIRVSELVGLNLGQVDFIGGMIKVYGKGKKERLSPIGDKALQALRKYLSKLATEEKESQGTLRKRLALFTNREVFWCL